MTIGHLIVTLMGLVLVIFGAWYINQINKGDIK